MTYLTEFSSPDRIFAVCISVDGHDSHEDAKACLELMRWKVKEDVKRTARHKSPRLSIS